MATSTSDPKIDVKSAATIAMKYLRELIPTIPPDDISLEEVETTGSTWLVTLGFTDKHSGAFLRAVDSGRAYKEFRIDAKNWRSDFDAYPQAVEHGGDNRAVVAALQPQRVAHR